MIISTWSSFTMTQWSESSKGKKMSRLVVNYDLSGLIRSRRRVSWTLGHTTSVGLNDKNLL